MKKILSIAIIATYLFSISTLVHASTMGFFSHIGTETGHCHTHHNAAQNKTNSIDCCQYALSSDYTSTSIDIGYKDLAHHVLPTTRIYEIRPYHITTSL